MPAARRAAAIVNELAASPPIDDVPKRRPRRWRRRLLVAATLALLFAWVGCTSTVTPPANVGDPTTVFLLREAMHTGLVLPPSAANDEFVEFGFGDWSWFALGNDEWYQVFATILWPTQGTLGRRAFGARTADELRERVWWAELSPVVVDREKANALRTRLQHDHDTRLAEAVRRQDLGWTFVPFDSSYWFPNTCADVAADWFRDLDCSVSWVPIRAGLAAAAP